MKRLILPLMKAQQAASSGTSILPQHSLRFSAVQIDFRNAHSNMGGTMR